MIRYSRRTFLQAGLATGAFGALSSSHAQAKSNTQSNWPDDYHAPMKILILGGTRFLGPALVASALSRNHEVVLFNRGRSNPQLFPDLEKLIGDRDPNINEGLNALKSRTFDAVIDTSGYAPRIARASAELLADNIEQYLFISSLSVYADQSKSGIVETDPVATMDDPTQEKVTAQTYGPLKALSEEAIEDSLPGRATLIRPGLIVGPEDGTDRFTYWPVRVSRGGNVLSPGNPDDPVQYIDVRDLAEFCIDCLENNIVGTYNATGPRGTMTIAELLYGCKAVTGGDVSFTWVPAEFLAANNVMPWSEMPVWLPPGSSAAGLAAASNAKAIAKGLKFRPLAETARDTLLWFKSLPPERQSELRAGIDADRESEILTKWATTNEE